MEEVPGRTSLVPLAFPCFALCLIGVETEGLLDYQGPAGIISIVRWNLRPVIFGVDKLAFLSVSLENPRKRPKSAKFRRNPLFLRKMRRILI